jgi:hypothetical protein
MTPPSRATSAGRAYLDIQKRARADRRPVDEYLQFYVLECFLARLTRSRYAERYVLKGGALLAAFGERRPTSHLWTARTQFHIDVNVGDPIHPSPNAIEVPRLLGGELIVLGYPLAMVFAEKIVTAVARGTQSTRWRDFADIYLLARRHHIDGGQLTRSIREVAAHRGTELAPLSEVLDDYGRIGQGQWSAWLRRQQMAGRLPDQFREVVAAVTTFADPAITGSSAGRQWLPRSAEWTATLVGEPSAVQSKHGTVRANRF